MQLQVTKEQIEFLRTQHLAIMTPMYGGLCYSNYVSALLELNKIALQIGMKISFMPLVNESLIPRARNTLVARALMDESVTKLLFIDADISFTPFQIIQMMLHEKEVIGGLYPKKTLPIDYVVNVDPIAVDAEGKIKNKDGLIPVTRMGTGMMMIDRSVFEKLMVAFPTLQFNNNIGQPPEINKYMYAFFDCWITTDKTREYVSEDWAFCQLVRSIGIEIWMDQSIRCDHTGTFTYPAFPDALYQRFGIETAKDDKKYAPHIAVRPDEVDENGKIAMPTQPDLDALKKWEESKTKKIEIAECFGNIKIV
jgi:hypothetical protein